MTYAGFRMIKFDTSSQASLRKKAQLGYDELIKLLRVCTCSVFNLGISSGGSTYLLWNEVHIGRWVQLSSSKSSSSQQLTEKIDDVGTK